MAPAKWRSIRKSNGLPPAKRHCFCARGHGQGHDENQKGVELLPFLGFSDDDIVSLGSEERAGGQLDLRSAEYLREFRLEDGLPVWTYHVRDLVLEKRVLLLHLQNTVHLIYRIIEGQTRPRLRLRP